jgi:hypothetical protein
MPRSTWRPVLVCCPAKIATNRETTQRLRHKPLMINVRYLWNQSGITARGPWFNHDNRSVSPARCEPGRGWLQDIRSLIFAGPVNTPEYGRGRTACMVQRCRSLSIVPKLADRRGDRGRACIGRHYRPNLSATEVRDVVLSVTVPRMLRQCMGVLHPNVRTHTNVVSLKGYLVICLEHFFLLF